jgi:hypothetical protein
MKNRNAFKHGHETREARQQRASLRALLAGARTLINDIEDDTVS